MEVDARLLGRPAKFDGAEGSWSDWSFQLRAYAETLDSSMGVLLDAGEAQPDAVLSMANFPDQAQANSKKLYYVLAMLLTGSPLLILKKTERGNGFEAWRQLRNRYEASATSRLHHLLGSIMKPKAFAQDGSGLRVCLAELGVRDPEMGEHVHRCLE